MNGIHLKLEDFRGQNLNLNNYIIQLQAHTGSFAMRALKMTSSTPQAAVQGVAVWE